MTLPCPPATSEPSRFDGDGLEPAQAFVVAELRLWAAPYREPGALHPDWREGFAAANAEDAMAPFDALFRIVTAHALRALDVRCLHCPHVGEDEAAFLRMLALLQRHRWTEAEALLADWLPDEALRPALAQATLFATAIAGAGLRLPFLADDAHPAAAAIPFLAPQMISRSVH